MYATLFYVSTTRRMIMFNQSNNNHTPVLLTSFVKFRNAVLKIKKLLNLREILMKFQANIKVDLLNIRPPPFQCTRVSSSKIDHLEYAKS